MRTVFLTLAATALAGSLPAQAAPARPDTALLSYDAAARHAAVRLDAATSPSNGGLNFDGYSGGALTIILPSGWRLEVRMRNLDANLPHSVALIPADGPLPVQVTEPVLPGAATPSPMTGTAPHDSAAMTFAPPAGRYRLVCAVPGHALAGMWVTLIVSDSAKAPALRTGT